MTRPRCARPSARRCNGVYEVFGLRSTPLWLPRGTRWGAKAGAGSFGLRNAFLIFLFLFFYCNNQANNSAGRVVALQAISHRFDSGLAYKIDYLSMPRRRCSPLVKITNPLNWIWRSRRLGYGRLPCLALRAKVPSRRYGLRRFRVLFIDRSASPATKGRSSEGRF